MSTLSDLARIRVGYESPIEKWMGLSVKSMVKQSISHIRFMYSSLFRIRNFKFLVWRVFIFFHPQILMERNDVMHEIFLKFLNIFSASFSIQKLLPRLE